MRQEAEKVKSWENAEMAFINSLQIEPRGTPASEHHWDCIASLRECLASLERVVQQYKVDLTDRILSREDLNH